MRFFILIAGISLAYASFGIDAVEIDNGASVVMGIALILVSLILSYGTELEQKNRVQEDIGE